MQVTGSTPLQILDSVHASQVPACKWFVYNLKEDARDLNWEGTPSGRLAAVSQLGFQTAG